MTDTDTTADAPTDGEADNATRQPDSTGSSQASSPADDRSAQEEQEKDYRKLYEQVLAQSRKWESRAKENSAKAKRLDEIEEANRTEAEKHQARAEQAEARARAAITSAINAEIRAAAHGWANPADAPRYLDDKDRYVGDNGEIDLAAIAEDVAAVLKDRPHLAAAEAGRRGPNPDPGQGHRGGLSISDQIREAERKGDHREALRLKTQQLLARHDGR
ncbi:hypothetical protein SAMN05421810_10184 [Amycolatopsis arida]|uniref:Uncharacterized protein n=1 Tax=Amycolatopsis arida TaxID=587909 RepID=A0A1I5KDA2_9PSEU|nr:hypothetical protein [Amycolatopsis arida]TDX96980.1 hypothetical protein CLV69_10282 [Amycolatopsis arida]SFO82586.1 hypothetical protein SAMN05421810_10184 [Amycolatopsis arida]